MIGWIVWGTGGDKVYLEVSPQKKFCPCCEQERYYHTSLHYRYAHLYWLFQWITEKHYYHLCEVCQRGWELDLQEGEALEKALPNNPIPFIARFGWAFLIVPVVLIFAVGIFSSSPNSTTQPSPSDTLPTPSVEPKIEPIP
jgi:hypothetical protein